MPTASKTAATSAARSDETVVVRRADEHGRGGCYTVPAHRVDAMRRHLATIGAEYRNQ